MFQVPSSSHPGEYDGSIILLDLVEQALSFAMELGLSCHDICYFLSLYVSVLALIANSGDSTGKVYHNLHSS